MSPAVESMIRRCLEPEPERRYQDANHLREDIERHLTNYPLQYARNPSLLERTGKWRRRHPSLTSTTAMALLAVFTLAPGLLDKLARLEGQPKSPGEPDLLEFHEDFERSQLLLNTDHDGSNDHLIRGLDLARSSMGPYLDDDGSLMTSSPAFENLPRTEQASLRSGSRS